MARVIIIAAGNNLENLPAEVKDVANILSAAEWTVRLCIGGDASRAGLRIAMQEGSAELVWLGCHSNADGFMLTDGMITATQLGIWLGSVRASETVLNSCYSQEHVDDIQRATNVNIAATVDPKGVDDMVAWSTAVYIAREYAETNNMQTAVRMASGNHALKYRYFPYEYIDYGASGDEGGMERSMVRVSSIAYTVPERELLQQLQRAVSGDSMTSNGMLARMDALLAKVERLKERQMYLIFVVIVLALEQIAFVAERFFLR